MLAPVHPRPEPLKLLPTPALREVAPGVHLFRCSDLHAELMPRRCAEHWRAAAYRSCRACDVGKAFASAVWTEPKRRTELRPDVCSRCGAGSTRLVRRSLCKSCYNRQREVVLGANSKGNAPILAMRELRQVHVLVDGVPADFDQVTGDTPADPRIERAGRGGRLLTFVASGEAEVRRIMDRRWPDLQIVDLEVVASNLAEEVDHV